jgi:hypothetical protein
MADQSQGVFASFDAEQRRVVGDLIDRFADLREAVAKHIDRMEARGDGAKVRTLKRAASRDGDIRYPRSISGGHRG